MSATSDDNSLSNVSCRILVLSSSISQATSFIDRIQNHNRDGPEAPHTSNKLSGGTTSTPDSPVSSSELPKIPWTITNKYYSAEVHFAVRAIHGLSSHRVQNVPALVFVWAQGESYKHHIERISQHLGGHGPEVCLAVRIPPNPSISYDGEEGSEEDVDIDAFVSTHGFEYINVVENSLTAVSEDPDDEAFNEDIPGLPRVLDALSTIMWPSMQTTSKTTDRQRERALLDWAQASQDNSISMEDDTQLSDYGSKMGREIEELTFWLEGDESLREDPWKTASANTSSPTSMEFGDLTQAIEGTTGFEDNFTVFVSAPPVDPHASDRSTPDGNPAKTTNLSLPRAGNLYRSLGSDFGGSDDGMDEDEVLPSKQEIEETSRRIFGGPEPRVVSIIPGQGLEEDEGSYEMGPFDLSKVVGALQEIKAEIGLMDDEGERRKAAAKVALGLVYGLES